MTSMYNSVTNQLRQQINESKIGQVVPHLDTPAISYGLGVTQKCAKYLLGRRERMPFPKLGQLESLGDLYSAYGESYPARLDVFCVLLALFPLCTLAMKKEYTFHIYVAPYTSTLEFVNGVGVRVVSPVKRYVTAVCRVIAPTRGFCAQVFEVFLPFVEPVSQLGKACFQTILHIPWRTK